MEDLKFLVTDKDSETHARCGVLETPHGCIQTPVFMPVGTQATVKSIWPDQLETMDAKIILGNTYHLGLRPGADLIEKCGGLHQFMGWKGAILTDSGGFQVFSLKSTRKIAEEGVRFKSHIDGNLFDMSPESSMKIQAQLGSDIVMAFDECPELPCEDSRMSDSLQRTARWLKRCRDSLSKKRLFGIVQGGLSKDLRLESLERTLEVDIQGLAIGGLSVGESRLERLAVLDMLKDSLPEALPHYLMGVGRPLDLVESVARGIDMFDCVMPTREGRHGVAYTSHGRLRIRNLIHRESEEPLDSACACSTCTRFSRAYLRHLFVAGEQLGAMALSLHNLHYYLNLMRRVRKAIQEGTFEELLGEIQKVYL